MIDIDKIKCPWCNSRLSITERTPSFSNLYIVACFRCENYGRENDYKRSDLVNYTLFHMTLYKDLSSIVSCNLIKFSYALSSDEFKLVINFSTNLIFLFEGNKVILELRNNYSDGYEGIFKSVKLFDRLLEMKAFY